MSKWISGQQILKNKKIQPIELFEEYVHKGIPPYSQTGRPLSPYELLEGIYAKMLSNADHGKSPLVVEGNENNGGDIVVNIPNSITLEIYISKELQRLNVISWQDFQLPEADNEAKAVLDELSQCLYKKSDVSGKPEQKPKKKPRPDQLARKQCRVVANALWEHDPTITIKAMSKRQELIDACGGAFTDKTKYGWIRDLARSDKPGRRPQKKNNK